MHYCLAVHIVAEKMHNSLRHFHAKGTWDLQSFIYVSVPTINLCFSPFAAISHWQGLASIPQHSIPAVICAVNKIELQLSTYFTSTPWIILLPFQPSLFALLLSYACFTIISINLSRQHIQHPVRSGAPFKTSKMLQQWELRIIKWKDCGH